jgi:hypothetical protein
MSPTAAGVAPYCRFGRCTFIESAKLFLNVYTNGLGTNFEIAA